MAMHILVIDRDPAQLCEIKSKFLKNQDEFTFDSSLNGSEGIEKIRNNEFDLVLCGYQLSEMNGIEVLQHARSLGFDLPFIILNDEGNEEIAVEAMRHGANDYLTVSSIREDVFPAQVRQVIESYRTKKDNERLQTERQRAEENLRLRDDRLRAIVENAQDAIISADQEKGILSWNHGAEKIFGFTEKEMLGKPLNLIVAAEYREKFQKLLTMNQRQMLGNRLECPGNRSDGGAIVLEIALAMCELGDEKLINAIVRDVTIRKRAEMALVKAKEAAEEAAELKSQFLANMSHEIRTPMNAVIGMTELLLRTNLDAEQKDYVDTIITSGDALLSLINDILDFSKIDANRLELEKHPFELRGCIERAMDIVAPKVAGKDLDLAFVIEETVPQVIQGDVVRLSQIIINLLSNAVKFTENGEIVVSVSSSPIAAANHHEIHVAVRDTGIGIPEDKLTVIFQSFRQVDMSITRKYGGTGLGLAICERLVALMGGRIWAENNKDRGSTFHFTIQVEASSSQPEKMQEVQVAQLVGKRVIIVDDNDTNRKIMTKQTEAWGMFPDAYASSKEALEAIAQGKTYDLGLIDQLMPEMDGLTFAEEIKKCPGAEAIILIMVTSVGKMPDLTRRSKQRFSALLTKPIKSAQLYSTIMAVFSEPVEQLERSQEVTEHSEQQKESPEKSLKILVADDSVVNQKVIARMLEKMSHIPYIVNNGHEAIKSLEDQEFDLVLMDCQMPDLDGYRATQEIRKRGGQLKTLPIIAMTAHALTGDREKCINAGMSDYMSKPIRSEKLNTLLLRWGGSFDSEVFENLKELGEDHFRDVIRIYLEECPKNILALEQAIAQSDTQGSESAAHSMKGSSSVCGAKALSTICAEVEGLCKQGNLNAARDLLENVKAEFNNASMVFEHELQNL